MGVKVILPGLAGGFKEQVYAEPCLALFYLLCLPALGTSEGPGEDLS
jgi:hypothetical protein